MGRRDRDRMSSESERRSFNNDGMDPNWRPGPASDKPNKIDNLFTAVQYLADVLKTHDLKTKDHTRVTMPNQKWDAIIAAFEALK